MIEILATLKNNDKVRKKADGWNEVVSYIEDIIYCECHEELKSITIKRINHDKS